MLRSVASVFGIRLGCPAEDAGDPGVGVKLSGPGGILCGAALILGDPTTRFIERPVAGQRFERGTQG